MHRDQQDRLACLGEGHPFSQFWQQLSGLHTNVLPLLAHEGTLPIPLLEGATPPLRVQNHPVLEGALSYLAWVHQVQDHLALEGAASPQPAQDCPVLERTSFLLVQDRPALAKTQDWPMLNKMHDHPALNKLQDHLALNKMHDRPVLNKMEDRTVLNKLQDHLVLDHPVLNGVQPVPSLLRRYRILTRH